MKRKIRNIIIVLLVVILCFSDVSYHVLAKKTDYSKYSTLKHEWGLALNAEHKVPGNGESGLFKGKNTYYYIHTKKKKIYLTFDCGYENGYTGKILDKLKKKKVKAIFFVTKSYIEYNKDLVIRMKEEGHLVGNHTVNHPSLPTCSVSKIESEILDCEKCMKELTGYEMDKYIRPPMGEWSEQSLQVTKDLGYRTILWSMAFYDYDVDNQPGKDIIFNKFMQNYHKGAIVLMHAVSKSDTYAISSIIKEMRKKGYDFYQFENLKDR